MDGREIFLEADRQSGLGNHKKAHALLLKAEVRGFWPAQNSIGYVLDHGLGVRKNKRAAFHWYKKAARNGDLCAIGNLGLCYRDKGNERRALFWLRRAIKAGDGDSAFELAKLYARKRQNSRTLARARRYLRLAIRSKSVTESSMDGARKVLRELERLDGSGREWVRRRLHGVREPKRSTGKR